MENTIEDVPIPTVSFSLAAIVRRCTKQSQEQQRQQRRQPQEYAIVHEKPPRGWWLPGGGIEHVDATPVDAAIRESVEEAGTSSLLPLLNTLSKSTAGTQDVPELNPLPYMTHLLSLEQTPGRIRFIFRGEWIDDSVDDTSKVLKVPPGDEESIEAKWITWDEVLHFKERKPSGMNKLPPMLQSISDPWLRGHEPTTFFGMLEFAYQKDGPVPGLPVHTMNVKSIDYKDRNVMGAFFGRMQRVSADESSADEGLISYGSRAALITHLRCRLVAYDKSEQTFAIDDTSNAFPTSYVKDQNDMTLKQLVDGMIANFIPSKAGGIVKSREVGLLRVEYMIHGNGREATLTVFPFISINATNNEVANQAISWVSANHINDDLEKKLTEAILDNQIEKKYLNIDILRDDEGPITVTDDISDLPAISKEELDAEGSAFLQMMRASQESDKM